MDSVKMEVKHVQGKGWGVETTWVNEDGFACYDFYNCGRDKAEKMVRDHNRPKHKAKGRRGMP